MDYIENTKIAIVGVIAIAIISIFQLTPTEAKEIVLVTVGGLIGYIARGNESKV